MHPSYIIYYIFPPSSFHEHLHTQTSLFLLLGDARRTSVFFVQNTDADENNDDNDDGNKS